MRSDCVFMHSECESRSVFLIMPPKQPARAAEEPPGKKAKTDGKATQVAQGKASASAPASGKASASAPASGKASAGEPAAVPKAAANVASAAANAPGAMASAPDPDAVSAAPAAPAVASVAPAPAGLTWEIDVKERDGLKVAIAAETYARQVLPGLLNLHGDLASQKPLPPVNAPALGKVKGTGFKEVWVEKNAEHCLQREGLYEAGGNLAWATLRSPGPFAVDRPSLQDVLGLKERLFGLGLDRLIFPGGPVACYSPCRPVDLQCPQGLALVGNPTLVCAFWVAMAECAKENDATGLRTMLECCLTTTLQVYCPSLTMTQPEFTVRLATRALKLSESLKAEVLVSDSFLLFTEKLYIILGEVSDMNQADQVKMVSGLTERLTFNGQKVDKNIISAAVSVYKVKAKSPVFLAWLQDFTDQHGQTLTHSSKKMRSLTKQGPEMAEFCIKMLCSLVSRCLLQVSELTEDVVEKYCGIIAAMKALFDALDSIVALLPVEVASPQFLGIFKMVKDPGLYDREKAEAAMSSLAAVVRPVLMFCISCMEREKDISSETCVSR